MPPRPPRLGRRHDGERVVVIERSLAKDTKMTVEIVDRIGVWVMGLLIMLFVMRIVWKALSE